MADNHRINLDPHKSEGGDGEGISKGDVVYDVVFNPTGKLFIRESIVAKVTRWYVWLPREIFMKRGLERLKRTQFVETYGTTPQEAVDAFIKLRMRFAEDFPEDRERYLADCEEARRLMK